MPFADALDEGGFSGPHSTGRVDLGCSGVQSRDLAPSWEPRSVQAVPLLGPGTHWALRRLPSSRSLCAHSFIAEHPTLPWASSMVMGTVGTMCPMGTTAALTHILFVLGGNFISIESSLVKCIAWIRVTRVNPSSEPLSCPSRGLSTLCRREVWSPQGTEIC